MDRRLWTDISESQTLVVLVDNVRWNLLADDLHARYGWLEERSKTGASAWMHSLIIYAKFIQVIKLTLSKIVGPSVSARGAASLAALSSFPPIGFAKALTNLLFLLSDIGTGLGSKFP